MKNLIKIFKTLFLWSLSLTVCADNSSLQYFQTKAATQQMPEAAVALKNKDYAKALGIYQHFADGGLVAAQYMLGYLYQNGLGVAQNNDMAAAWYGKASDQGLPEGQFALGMMRYYGLGISQGLTEAIYLLSQAAKNNHPLAQYMLGYFYANGNGLTQDTSAALDWYTKAAKQGVPQAQYNLGLLYYADRKEYSKAANCSVWPRSKDCPKHKKCWG
jgi:hypothetical protein